MGGSSISNQVDDVFYHSQPPIYHTSMGGSSLSNQVDDFSYHPQPQPPIYHPAMGGSSSANFSEPYVPDFYQSQSQTPMYPGCGGNIDYEDITNFMAVTSISTPIFSPHSTEYAFTTPPPMRPVVDDDDDDDDDAPQRPQRERRPPQRYESTTFQHGQKLRRR
ncbi:hypothetical protein V6N13_046692 [Hibiscus sabdariffa]